MGNRRQRFNAHVALLLVLYTVSIVCFGIGVAAYAGGVHAIGSVVAFEIANEGLDAEEAELAVEQVARSDNPFSLVFWQQLDVCESAPEVEVVAYEGDLKLLVPELRVPSLCNGECVISASAAETLNVEGEEGAFSLGSESWRIAEVVESDKSFVVIHGQASAEYSNLLTSSYDSDWLAVGSETVTLALGAETAKRNYSALLFVSYVALVLSLFVSSAGSFATYAIRCRVRKAGWKGTVLGWVLFGLLAVALAGASALGVIVYGDALPSQWSDGVAWQAFFESVRELLALPRGCGELIPNASETLVAVSAFALTSGLCSILAGIVAIARIVHVGMR